MTSVSSQPTTSPTKGTSVAGMQEKQGESTQTRGTTLTGQVMVNKMPLQRLKPAIHKYLKVLDIHLHRLQRHQYNMDKLTKAEQWLQLHKEQLNATGTVLQIAACLQQLQHTRDQVVDNQVSNLHTLLLRGQDFKVKVVGVLHNFLLFCQGKQPECDISGDGESADGMTSDTDGSVVMPATPGIPGAAEAREVSSTCAVPDNTCAAASRDQLTQEMEALHANVLRFVQTVTTETEETAENGNNENVSTASVGSNKLDKASKLKMAVLPVMGALLGGVVAGPMGALAGIKIGTFAGGVGGGVAAFATGTILRSQKKNSSANVCSPENKNDETMALQVDSNDTSSILQPLSSQNVSVTQHSSPATHSTTDSISRSTLQQMVPKTSSTTERGVDNEQAHQPQGSGGDDGGDDDDDGNSMSLWDQFLHWQKGPLLPQ